MAYLGITITILGTVVTVATFFFATNRLGDWGVILISLAGWAVAITLAVMKVINERTMVKLNREKEKAEVQANAYREMFEEHKANSESMRHTLKTLLDLTPLNTNEPIRKERD